LTSRLILRCAIVALWLLAPRPAAGSPEDFPKPAGLVTQVEFWKKIFAQYSENQVVVHDDLYLDKIYTVIDLRSLAENGADDETLRRERHRREEHETKRIDATLARLAKGGYSPDDLDAEERTIWNLFRDVDAPRKFSEARERVRTQQGLRERFARGLEVSRRYLPYMEDIFRREGLPVELTRLPFVESSFNIRAYSKAGAAGIWQFIPSSARIYLRLNEVEDSRRDPLYATLGAAHHLRDDHAVLGTWPLAITAYNHGRAGVARAVDQLGTTDIVKIIENYEGKSFGFASRNFYTEFLAALEVEREYKAHFGEVRFEPRLQYQEVQIRDYLRFSTLAKLARCSTEDLRELNPGFTNSVFDGKLFVPRGYTVRVPAGHAQQFRVAYAKLPAAERFSQQRRLYIAHRVKRGQTIGAIAKRYRTTVAAIQVANRLRDSKRLRPGQVLKIPTG
jgi:membrane-bound lytic murein transglycosylase D